ncbi:MAG: hypothetical protein AB1742_15365 [bacterium]
MKIRVWAEYLKPGDVVKKKVTGLLKRYDVCLGMAFPPGSMNREYAGMMKAYEGEGLEVALWPLLDDESGYWVSERNADQFFDLVRRMYDWAEGRKFSIPWLAVDLEPPVYQLNRVKKAAGVRRAAEAVRIYMENRDRSRFYEAARRFGQAQEHVHARGARTLAAAMPLVVEDLVRCSTGIQNALETPVSVVHWDVVSFMLYTSMSTGYLKRLGMKPEDSRWYLYSVCSDAKNCLWDRAGVSIGVTGTGKLGDEPYYETPEELLPDMRAAKAALIEDVAIYNLEGILRGGKPEKWFEALVAAEPEIPRRSPKVDAFRRAMQLAAGFA